MKTKIVGILVFPYKNKLVVEITRGQDFFCFPFTKRTYSIDYTSKRLSSFLYWLGYAELLNREHIVKYFLKLNGVKSGD